MSVYLIRILVVFSSIWFSPLNSETVSPDGSAPRKSAPVSEAGEHVWCVQPVPKMGSPKQQHTLVVNVKNSFVPTTQLFIPETCHFSAIMLHSLTASRMSCTTQAIVLLTYEDSIKPNSSKDRHSAFNRIVTTFNMIRHFIANYCRPTA
jgi:hypothetical protein